MAGKHSKNIERFINPECNIKTPSIEKRRPISGTPFYQNAYFVSARAVRDRAFSGREFDPRTDAYAPILDY